MTGALAGLGLVAAYTTWQRPKETASTSSAVKVLDSTKQSLEAVKFEDGQRFLTLKRVDGALWLTSGWVPGKEPAAEDAGITTTLVALDGGLDADGGVIDAGTLEVATKAAKPAPTREVRANERAETAMQKFMPFEATRALGVLSDEKLSELGLTGSDRKLELTVAGSVRGYTVAKVLPGIFGTYLQDARSKEVFLLPGSMLADFDPQSQVLIDRRLHTFKQSEFDAFVVKAEGKEAAFVQTNAEIPSTAKVARAASPEKPDELVKNWHEKIWARLIVTEVLGKGELPNGKEPTLAMRIDYTQKGKEKGFIEIGVGPANSMWARSENTASWVAVHQGTEELLIEAKKLVLEP
jgi:hypothetical protein